MDRQSTLAYRLDFVIITVLLLVRQLVPSLRPMFGWQFWLIAGGVLMVVHSLIIRKAGWVIAGAVVAGVGACFLLQPGLGRAAWLWMPAFLGVGLALSDLTRSQHKPNLRIGLGLVGVSVIAFLLFGGVTL